MVKLPKVANIIEKSYKIDRRASITANKNGK
jgi:hypothetical protein